MSDTLTFADLFAEGLQRVKTVTDKNLAIVRDEMGFALGLQGGRTLEKWQSGQNMPKPAYIEPLLRYLQTVDPPYFDHQWGKRFIDLSRHPHGEFLYQSIYGGRQIQTSPFGPEQSVRLKFMDRFEKLVGRENTIEEVIDALDVHPIVSITGQGGIGKSRIASEVKGWVLENSRFERVIWQTASTGHVSLSSNRMTFEYIIGSIYAEIDKLQAHTLTFDEKCERVRHIFKTQKILLILDNMETAAEPTESIINRLSAYLDPSAVLITSRHRSYGAGHEIYLEGLSAADAVTYLTQKSGLKGIAQIQHLTDEAHQQIWRLTGGSPLALQLIASKLRVLELDRVMGYFKTIPRLSTGSRSGINEYDQFYRYVFLHSWLLLSDHSKELLLALARFDNRIGANFNGLMVVSDKSELELPNLIESLWSFSLLETRYDERLSSMRYFTHSLTQHFVLSVIAKVI